MSSDHALATFYAALDAIDPRGHDRGVKLYHLLYKGLSSALNNGSIPAGGGQHLPAGPLPPPRRSQAPSRTACERGVALELSERRF